MAKHKCGFGELERKTLFKLCGMVKDIDKKVDYMIESRRNDYYSCKDG